MKRRTAESVRDLGPCYSIAFLTLAVVVSQTISTALAAQPLPPAVTSSGVWRAMSRDANMQFSDKEYAKAIVGYKSAIAELERADPESESLLDLYINLAETYRLRGDRQNALLFLDKVGPKILSRKCDDPLFPARYWRRRADLLSGVDNGRAYAAAYARALRIASDNLPDEYRPIINDKLLFLRNVSAMHLFDYAAPLALEMARTVPASSYEADQINQALKYASLKAREEVEHQLWVTDSHPRDALLLLSYTASDKSDVLYLLNRWLNTVKQPKAGDYKFAETVLGNITTSKSRSAQTAPNAEANNLAQLMLAKLCYLQGRAPEAVAHQNAARPLIASNDKRVIELLDGFAWFCFEQGAWRIGKEQIDSLTEQLLRAACDFQPLDAGTSSKQGEFNSLDKIALYKMNLARVLNSLGRVDQSVVVMDSIPAAALKRQNEKYWLRYGRINCSIAQSQANHGAPDAAKARFAKVTRLLALIKDPARARNLRDCLAESQRGAN